MNLSFRDETQDENYEPSHDPRQGRYEGYEPDLPERYDAYGQSGNADPVYDDYNPEQRDPYDTYVTEGISRSKRSLCKEIKSCCCDMGKTNMSEDCIIKYNPLLRTI